MIRSTGRTSRKPRHCGCGTRINVGDRYVRCTAAPGSEIGNTGWSSIDECADCAGRYGRQHLIDGTNAPVLTR